MKKTYVSPLSVEVSVASEQMLASSELRMMKDAPAVDTSDEGAQLGGNRRGEWGNLW